MMVISPVVAGDFGFVLDEFDVNSDVFIGFAPTFLTAGLDYSGLQLLDGQSTDIIFIAGGGYTQREIWRDETGAVLSYADSAEFDSDVDNRIFNVITGEWKLLLEQGIFWSDATYDDLITVYGGYMGRYEKYLENKGGAASYFLDSTNDAIYPEAEQLVSNTLTCGIRLETKVNEKVLTRGFDLELSASYAPAWMMNTLFDSTVDYYSATGTLTSYLPLYENRRDDGMNLVSVFLADRVRADYIEGPAVPVYAQKKPSLGYKMRGFESSSYATSFTVVNNFDIRITGPEFIISGLFPRAAVFCDVGYYDGHYANDPSDTDSGMLLSTGGEIALSVLDFLNVGLRANYVLLGETMNTEPFSTDIFMVLHY